MMAVPDDIWVSNRHGPDFSEPKAALLLDRDGVLVDEVQYLCRVSDVRLAAGAVALLRWAMGKAIPVAVITNQAGIGRGLYDWPAYHAIEAEIDAQLARYDLRLDLVIACPYHPGYTANYGAIQDYWRKPGPGMVHLAADLLALDLTRSWMIGDKDSDIGAAKAAGLPGAVHLLCGHGKDTRAAALKLAAPDFAVLAADDLHQALNDLEKEKH